MANKKLGTVARELSLPAKKVKGEKKPKWQAKTGGNKAKEVEVAEPVEAGVDTPVTELAEPLEVTRPSEMPSDEIASEPAPTVEPTDAPPTDKQTTATDPEPTPATSQCSPKSPCLSLGQLGHPVEPWTEC